MADGRVIAGLKREGESFLLYFVFLFEICDLNVLALRFVCQRKHYRHFLWRKGERRAVLHEVVERVVLVFV